MNPGRELDALIAEKVMGWTKLKKELIAETGWDLYGINSKEEGDFLVPEYSFDIAAAWEVVAKVIKEWRLDKPGRNIKISRSLEKWEVEIKSDFKGRDAEARSDSAPHAICLAALKAVGYTF